MKAKHTILFFILGILVCTEAIAQNANSTELNAAEILLEHFSTVFEYQFVDLDGDKPNDEKTGISLIGVDKKNAVTISFEGKTLKSKENHVFPALIKDGILVVSYAGREQGSYYASLELYIPKKETKHRYNMKQLLRILMDGESSAGTEVDKKPGSDSPGITLHKSLKALENLRSRLEWPDHLVFEGGGKRGDEFDVQKYFTVLKHLSMKKDYQLDYVYNCAAGGGQPVLYSRRQGQPPYESHQDFTKAIRKRAHLDEVEVIEKEFRKRIKTDGFGSAYEWQEKQLAKFPEHKYWEWYLDDIHVDGTPQGWLELVALSLLGDQFYLFWHANYNDTMIISDRSALPEVSSGRMFHDYEIPPIVTQLGTAIDFRPLVKVKDESVFVSIVTFSKWGGFEELNFRINKTLPHRIRQTSNYTLIYCQCGGYF